MLNIRLLFIVWAPGAGWALTEARLMKVCCLISQIDSVRKTPLPELSDTIHLLDDIPQR